MDKVVAKRLAAEAGVPIVPYIAFRAGEFQANPDRIVDRAIKELGLPLFVKPARLGSSIGISKVKEPAKLQAAILDALRYDDKILIEKGLDVREIECAVLGGYDPDVSIPGEVIPHAEFYTYEAKYIDADGAGMAIPAKLTPEQTEAARQLAKQTFQALELYGMARVDLFLDKNTGKFYLNEVNTIPGFTEISQYPMLWRASGLTDQQLLDRLVQLAIARRDQKKRLLRERS
jgi:D-alanine-D-alanine ligase